MQHAWIIWRLFVTVQIINLSRPIFAIKMLWIRFWRILRPRRLCIWLPRAMWTDPSMVRGPLLRPISRVHTTFLRRRAAFDNSAASQKIFALIIFQPMRFLAVSVLQFISLRIRHMPHKSLFGAKSSERSLSARMAWDLWPPGGFKQLSK